MPEDKVLKEVSEVFKSIAVPQDMLDEITSYLQQSHESEKQYHGQKLISLRKENDSIKDKVNRLLDLHLERVISKEEYHSKKEDLERQLAKVKTEQEMHESADGGFKDAVVTAFNLANKASELFESSKTTEKRELIGFVFSNLSLRGKELEYTLRQPFNMMVNLHDRAEWLPIIDEFRTNIEEINQTMQQEISCFG